MTILRPAVLFAAIILFAATGSQVAFGDSHASPTMSVIVAQPGAIPGDAESTDLIESFVGLAGNLRDGELFTFFNAVAPVQSVGPATAGESEFRVFRDGVVTNLSSVSGAKSDIVGAIAESYNLLDSGDAARGSTVYIIAKETGAEDFSRMTASSEPIVGLLRQNGWTIIGLSLPGASSEMRGFLNQISAMSGGEALELSPQEGLTRFAELTLRQRAQGSLGEVGTAELGPSDVLNTQFSVAPGTSEATLLLFKDGPKGSLRLSNPAGTEAAVGDRTTSSLIETPHMVIWTLTDPMPGAWNVEVRGIEGAVSAWDYASNKYVPVLDSFDTVPLGQPSALIASVRDGDERVTLDGVQLTASVIAPSGATLVHSLNDDGRLGDSIAGDGFFSATIPPVAVKGDYLVELELAWPQFDHAVSARSGFSVQPFPSIDVTPIQTEGFVPGERSKVSTLFVNIEGEPYAIATSELTASLASNQRSGAIDIVPQQLLSQGRAWMFDVFFTPETESLETVNFGLSMDYAGRQYVSTSDFVVLSSLVPAPPFVPIAQVAPPAPPAPVAEAAPTAFPMGLIVGPLVAVAALLAAAAIYWLTRTRPYGYLYDDRNERVADFGALKRRPLKTLLFRNVVRGKELGVPGLDGVWFRFSGKRIRLRSEQATPTVRVNNQPLVGQTNIRDRTYIGTHGRLFTFLLSPMSLQLDASAGDD